MDFTNVSLTVLYLLQEAKVPLTIEQMSDALDSSDYTYIEISVAVIDLTDKGLVQAFDTPMGCEYSITVNGRITLSHLKNDVRGSVRKKILSYVAEKSSELKLKSKVSTRITKLDNGCYQVHLRAFDKDMLMNDILLVAHDEEEAKFIASNWENRADEAIASLYTVLMKDC